jgi:hypothetical protein
MKKLLTLLLLAAMLQNGNAQDSLLFIDVPPCNETAFFESCRCICHVATHTKCLHKIDSCMHHAQASPTCSLCSCGKEELLDSLSTVPTMKSVEEIFFHCGLSPAVTIVHNSGHFHCADCSHLCGSHCLQEYTCQYPRHPYGRAMTASEATCQHSSKSTSHYDLFTSKSPYSSLRNAKVLTSGFDWEAHEAILFGPPFPIFINGQQVLSFEIDIFFDYLSGTFADAKKFIDFVPIEADLIDRGLHVKKALSAIQYQTSGTVGNRIFKIEWKNVAAENDYPHGCMHLDHYLNYQLWFYEAGQHIEFRYGPSSQDAIRYFSIETQGIFAGIYGSKQLGFEDLAICGAPGNPHLGCEKGLLWDIPAAGTVYRLSPRPTLAKSTSDLLATTLEVQQDLWQDVVQVKTKGGSSLLQLFNLQGQLLLESQLHEQKASISLAGLPAGMYLLRQQGNPQTAKVLKH